MFRRVGVKQNLRQALETLDPALLNQQYKLSLYPACYGTGQVGILKIPNCTDYFNQILPYERFSRPVRDEYLTIDCDFDGFTPFNRPEEIYADVVAVTGLAGHAYGSWRSRESGRMWLQDFLPDDIPSIRIMSFGYDSRIDANKETDRMLDYARSFLSQLYNVRSSKEAQSRPIIFLGHSLGGTLILESLVEARMPNSRYSSLLDTTFATFFFGTPHGGLHNEELKAMAKDLISDENQTLDLLRKLDAGSDFLARQRTSLADILLKKKVVSFYETLGSEVVKKSEATGKYERSGDKHKAVNADAAILGLPGEIPIPVRANHTDIVKFLSPSDSTYISVLVHLKECVESIIHGHTTSLPPSSQVAAVQKGTGATSLHVACTKGDITSVRQLIESGADVNATDTGGRSPLLYAVTEAHEDIVQFLIDHRANVNFMTPDGASPLRVAMDKGHYSVMRTLLRHGANPNELGPKGHPLLMTPVYKGQITAIEILLENRADANATGPEGFNALYYAASLGHLDIVRALIAHGANVDPAESGIDTPLQQAAIYGHHAIVRALLEKGANINAVTTHNVTALLLAASFGQETVAYNLLQRGADPNIAAANKVTPLMMAACKGYQNIAHNLMANKANINATMTGDVSPLMLACSEGHYGIVTLLAQYGANLNATTGYGISPVLIASSKGHQAIVQALTTYGGLAYPASTSGHAVAQQPPANVVQFMGHYAPSKINTLAGIKL